MRHNDPTDNPHLLAADAAFNGTLAQDNGREECSCDSLCEVCNRCDECGCTCDNNGPEEDSAESAFPGCECGYCGNPVPMFPLDAPCPHCGE
jgi:hypothetical protein